MAALAAVHVTGCKLAFPAMDSSMHYLVIPAHTAAARRAGGSEIGDGAAFRTLDDERSHNLLLPFG